MFYSLLQRMKHQSMAMNSYLTLNLLYNFSNSFYVNYTFNTVLKYSFDQHLYTLVFGST